MGLGGRCVGFRASRGLGVCSCQREGFSLGEFGVLL